MCLLKLKSHLFSGRFFCLMTSNLIDLSQKKSRFVVISYLLSMFTNNNIIDEKVNVCLTNPHARVSNASCQYGS